MIWPFSLFQRPKTGAVSQWGNWVEWFSTPKTSAGVFITNENALTISTVFACIRNISEDVAKVPLKVYQKTADGKEIQPEHPLVRLLNHKPNPDMTAMDFRQAMTAHTLGWGNAYAEIETTLGGMVTGLYPLHPRHVRVKVTEAGTIYYEVTKDDGSIVNIPSERMFHVRGLGADGVIGYNVIEYARESLGIVKASEQFGGAYFGNNTVLGGILKHPTTLTENAVQRLKNSLREYEGPENANKILVLEEGMTWERPVIAPEASQFIETRQFSIPEVCRWFRMPPHKVADLQRATFSNIEHQDLEYVKDCLTAWFKRWEETIWWKLFSEREKTEGYFVEHTVEGLLRGDIQSRYGAYQIALGNNNNPGFMTVNEVRKLENLNPIDGGDELFSPQKETNNEEMQPDNFGNNE